MILIDIGGTHTRVSNSKDGKTLSKPVIFETPSDYTLGLKKLVGTIETLCPKKSPSVICVSIPGVVKNGLIISAHNIKEWQGNNLKNALGDVYSDSIVEIENDANLACLGEAKNGAGRGGRIVAYMTISTGVGGGRVVNGKIDSYEYGFEPGKQIIDLDNHSTMESLVSGKSIKEKYHKELKDIKDDSTLDELASYVAVGVYNTIVHWSPDVFVLGGSLILDNPEFFERVKIMTKTLMKVFPVLPDIKMAELGDLSGLYGALYYAQLIKSNLA